MISLKQCKPCENMTFEKLEKLASETLSDAKNEHIENPYFCTGTAEEILQRFLSHLYELTQINSVQCCQPEPQSLGKPQLSNSKALAGSTPFVKAYKKTDSVSVRWERIEKSRDNS